MAIGEIRIPFCVCFDLTPCLLLLAPRYLRLTNVLYFVCSTWDLLVWNGGRCWINGYYTSAACSMGEPLGRHLFLVPHIFFVPRWNGPASQAVRLILLLANLGTDC
jgi:hypothetical protein